MFTRLLLEIRQLRIILWLRERLLCLKSLINNKSSIRNKRVNSIKISMYIYMYNLKKTTVSPLKFLV